MTHGCGRWDANHRSAPGTADALATAARVVCLVAIEPFSFVRFSGMVYGCVGAWGGGLVEGSFGSMRSVAACFGHGMCVVLASVVGGR